MGINNKIYSQLVDELHMVASPFNIQSELFPDFVHLPDEIINAVDISLVPKLAKAGIISDRQRQAFLEYETFLDTWKVSEDYEAALNEIENGGWFEGLRKKALALLELLGEGYSRPTLEGISYVKAPNH